MLQSTVDTSILADMAQRYAAIRQRTEAICAPLETEDYVIQSCAESSPPRWHLAHTTWFFEHFILQPHASSYQSFDERHHLLFNSYYQTEGELLSKAWRGAFSRPTVKEVYAYRRHVDDAIDAFLSGLDEAGRRAILPTLNLGLAHEEQHQELLYYDIKHNFFVNPLLPAYDERLAEPEGTATPADWLAFEGGQVKLGYEGASFCMDNELPRHTTYCQPFALQDRLVTNAEYQAFVEAGGYRDSRYWLSDAWDHIHEAGWAHPLYWLPRDDGWYHFTLGGLRPLPPHAPVMHLSFYEAQAYATWRGLRLPTETEWEVAATSCCLESFQRGEGNFLESGLLAARPAGASESMPRQLFGDVWEWTCSPYAPYPGYQPLYEGTGEYNGKFMLNQIVMRGGSCYTPAGHIRPTYRNFFYPHDRWQAAGLRLAKDIN